MRCFLGTSDNGDEDQLMESLKFTDPYLGLGYVLVTQGAAKGINYDDLLKANIKVGVPMATPIDNFLFMKKFLESFTTEIEELCKMSQEKRLTRFSLATAVSQQENIRIKNLTWQVCTWKRA